MRKLMTGLACVLCLGAGATACSKDEGERPPSTQARTEPTSGGTSTMPTSQEMARSEEQTPKEVDVDLETAVGTELEGSAELKQMTNGVQIALEVEDAPPGKHGVHIHERGDCSDIPGGSMGGHMKSAGNEQHGLPMASAQHEIGDLGNIEVGSDGKGKLTVVVPNASLKPGAQQSFLGKALVVHADEDVGSGPAGGSGKPIACGVIKE